MALSMQQIIEQDIFNLMGFRTLSDEEKELVYQRAYETILNRILLRIAALLPEHDLDKFKVLLEENKPEGITPFFTARGLDIEEISMQETLAYKTEMAALAETLLVHSK